MTKQEAEELLDVPIKNLPTGDFTNLKKSLTTYIGTYSKHIVWTPRRVLAKLRYDPLYESNYVELLRLTTSLIQL